MNKTRIGFWKGLAALVVIVAALAFAPAAMAASSSVSTYGGAGGEVQSAVGEGAPSAEPAQVSQGALPFTGLDIGLAAGGGLLLIGVGAALALAVPRREESSIS